MRLSSEFLGALAAGALLFVIARQVGLGTRNALAAVALVPLIAATLLAVPTLRDDAANLLDQRSANSPLTAEEAQLQAGVLSGVDVGFLSWVRAHFGAEDTFHLVIGRTPGEPLLAGVGIREAAIWQWGLFQLAPNLAVEQTTPRGHAKRREGLQADWIVFYESSPASYPAGTLGEVETYTPGFAIARSRLAD